MFIDFKYLFSKCPYLLFRARFSNSFCDNIAIMKNGMGHRGAGLKMKGPLGKASSNEKKKKTERIALTHITVYFCCSSLDL